MPTCLPRIPAGEIRFLPQHDSYRLEESSNCALRSNFPAPWQRSIANISHQGISNSPDLPAASSLLSPSQCVCRTAIVK